LGPQQLDVLRLRLRLRLRLTLTLTVTLRLLFQGNNCKLTFMSLHVALIGQFAGPADTRIIATETSAKVIT
jgi:hypothetical protein